MTELTPYSESTERAAIGCILMGGLITAHEAFSKLSDECFYHPRWQSAWQTIKRMTEEAIPIDGRTFITEHMKSASVMEISELLQSQDGIPIHWRDIYGATPSHFNLPFYVDELLELAERRAALNLARTAQEELRTGKPTADAFAGLDAVLEMSNAKRSDIIDSTTFVQRGIDDLERRNREFNEHTSTTIKTGFYDLDKITGGFERGELVVIGARPNIGKSAMAITLATNMGEPCLVATLEMGPESLYRRASAVMNRIPLQTLKLGNFSERDLAALLTSNKRLKDQSFTLLDATAGITVSALRARISAAVHRHKISVVIVDYLQKVKPDIRGEKRNYDVADVSEGLQSIARRNAVLVIALAQLNRDMDKQDRPPRLTDLADSSQIEKDADWILLMHRERGDDGVLKAETKLFIAKARDGETGLCKLIFNAPTTRFDSISKVSDPI